MVTHRSRENGAHANKFASCHVSRMKVQDSHNRRCDFALFFFSLGTARMFGRWLNVPKLGTGEQRTREWHPQRRILWLCVCRFNALTELS